MCLIVGIASEVVNLPERTSQEELLSLIDHFNHDDSVDGLLVQLPVPQHMSEKRVSLSSWLEATFVWFIPQLLLHVIVHYVFLDLF